MLLLLGDRSWMSSWCLCLFLAAVSAQSDEPLYKKVGDDVILKPGPTTQPIKNILWKQGVHLAAQWDSPGTEIDLFRQFKDRGTLNISNGELMISSLTEDEAGVYTAEINNMVAGSTSLFVITSVPKPSILRSCEENLNSCVLTCDANITNAEPVTYMWTTGGMEKELRITKEETLKTPEFTCELKNPVSQESSEPVPNPFISAPKSSEGEETNMNVPAGATVFVVLLTAVLLVVVFHRWKSGMWFFQKASMPWQADFWRSQERTTNEAAELNGASSQRDKSQTDEET